MNKDLTWKLKNQPTGAEIAELVRLNVLTADEARDIIFNKGKREDASKLTTVVHVLLDGSGSMDDCRNETISGYNEYIKTLKKDGGKYKISLTTFDSGYDGEMRLNKIHESVYVDDVPKLTRKTFVPDGGTPLQDAFCTVLKDVNDRADEKHLFVVLTDGLENTSKKYTARDMKRLKSEYEDKENWTFVYLGANQDAFAVSQQWGYSHLNTSNFNATPKGINMMVASLGAATRSYSASSSMNTGAFYSEAQQKENELTK